MAGNGGSVQIYRGTHEENHTQTESYMVEIWCVYTLRKSWPDSLAFTATKNLIIHCSTSCLMYCRASIGTLTVAAVGTYMYMYPLHPQLVVCNSDSHCPGATTPENCILTNCLIATPQYLCTYTCNHRTYTIL